MVYPTIDPTSLIQKCEEQIAEFNRSNPGTFPFILRPIIAYDEIHSILTPLLSFLQEHLNGNDYVNEIYSIQDKAIQSQLWRARHYLFYQLLLIASATFTSQKLYDEIYVGEMRFYPYHSLTQDLDQFKLGIFGSLTPTSDIDVGIQYSGKRKDMVALAYIISCIESLFLILTGKNSLAYDIESYADMMTIPSSDERFSDLFYLDSIDFGPEELGIMLECAGASIVRNALISDPTLTRDDIVSYHEFDILKREIIRQHIPVPDSFFTFEWIDSAFNPTRLFLTSSYADQRASYYDAVDAAEKEKNNYLLHVSFSKLNNRPLSASQHTDKNRIICHVMKLIGNALSYRMESYTCAPTVVHVVRILQASKDKLKKYKTSAMGVLCRGRIKQLTEPLCSIGPYGFILSILEQIGYMYRFHHTYCEGGIHPDTTKCNKKMKKYEERLMDAYYFLWKSEHPETYLQPNIIRNYMDPSRLQNTTIALSLPTKSYLEGNYLKGSFLGGRTRRKHDRKRDRKRARTRSKHHTSRIDRRSAK